MKLTKILVIALACTSLVLAQEAAAPKAAAAKGAKKEAASAPIKGTFVSADAVAQTIIVKAGKKDDTLSVATDAKITSGKDVIQLADIKADSKVTVTCKTVDGKKVAEKIAVAAAAAPKATKTTTKKTESSSTTTTTEPAAAPATAPAK